MRFPWARALGAILAVAILAGGHLFNTGCGTFFSSFFSEVSVSTHELTFETTYGENPEAQTFIAYCAYFEGFFQSGCTADITTNVSWMTTDPSSIYREGTVTVNIDTEGMEPGTYYGRVHVEYVLVAVDDEEDVNVTLTINPAPEEDDIMISRASRSQL